ncbi:50S ribosomal protein L11 methyltransferase [Phytohabitans rumicis]|nr:50S ribosomal protein L11 methyltransferase [Phytohabitans rumicis]
MRLLLSIDRGHNVRRAVSAAIRPGARVLDAGTGSGLLSFVALAAGAGEVVGIDRHHVDVARALAAHNGFADRMTVVEADLAGLELPGVDLSRKFDVLLAFIHVNNPLIDEDRARLVYEVRDRFGTSDCTVLPNRVRYRVAGCDRLDWDLFTELSDLQESAGILHSVYGLDFQPLVDAAKQTVARAGSRPASAVLPQWRSPTTMASLRFPREDVRLLTDNHDFVTFDYGAPAFTGFPPQVRLRIATPGRLSGVIWTQELICDGQPVWTTESFSPLATARTVAAGDEVVLDADDEWRATNVLRSHHQPM